MTMPPHRIIPVREGLLSTAFGLDRAMGMRHRQQGRIEAAGCAGQL
jgi:hypothetical protein